MTFCLPPYCFNPIVPDEGSKDRSNYLLREDLGMPPAKTKAELEQQKNKVRTDGNNRATSSQRRRVCEKDEFQLTVLPSSPTLITNYSSTSLPNCSHSPNYMLKRS